MGGGTEHGDVHCRVRGRRIQLALPMVSAAQLGRVARCRALPVRLSPVRGSAARKHLPLPHHRGAGRPKGHRHGTLRHRSPPNVHGHDYPLPRHAVGAGFAHLLPHHAPLYPSHRQTHTQRRIRSGRGPQGLSRVQTTSEIQSFAVYLVMIFD